MTHENARSVAVIGGGPAGLMAAQTIAEAGFQVDVFDRMPTVGRKFLLAGRGGLNLTHGEPIKWFLTRYGGGQKQLEPHIRAFDAEALRAWSADLGEDTFVGSSGRVFPRAFKASPLLRAWLRRLDQRGVRFHTRHHWTGWDGAALTFQTPDGPKQVSADAVVLALGGASWARLGSDGAWTGTLAAEAIAVTPLVAANAGVAIAWTDRFRERFAGEPLKRIAIVIGDDIRRGEAVITETGLEGGAIYGALPALRQRDSVTIDLRPDMSARDLVRRLAGERGRDSLSTFLRKRLALPPVAIGLMREAAGVTLPTDPEALAAIVKSITLPLAGLEPIDRAISTAGGVAFDALDDHLMVRHKPGLFIAGEMLDWEAPTGGYLLQACFSTGVAAGRGVVHWLGGTLPAPLAKE